jgi:magnesium transporter
MIQLRKSIWPLRELVGALLRTESNLIRKETHVFLRDVYDHTIQIIDTVESLRDTLSGLLDLSFSITSNRMNEVMKVLTIIATIFIPLTFVAGIYGMNFEYMPELSVPWAYPVLLVILGVIASVMVLFFKRKNWL